MAAEVRNCLKTGDYVGPLWTTKIVREEGGGDIIFIQYRSSVAKEMYVHELH